VNVLAQISSAMTIVLKSKVEHLRSHKVGVVVAVRWHEVRSVRLRYMRMKWDNETEEDLDYYLVRELKEIKTTLSRNTKEALLSEESRQYKLLKRNIQFELDVLKFLNPDSSQDKIDEALANAPILRVNPDFLLKNHRVKTDSKKLKPPVSNRKKLKSVNSTTILAVEAVEKELQPADESDIDSDGEEDRSNRRINIDAVNYQVS
jgi:hypothetical protein